jgi:hypothetical protein
MTHKRRAGRRVSTYETNQPPLTAPKRRSLTKGSEVTA